MNGSQEEDLELHAFHLATIETATNYFSFANKIGEGGFGPVYKVMFSKYGDEKTQTLTNTDARESGTKHYFHSNSFNIIKHV